MPAAQPTDHCFAALLPDYGEVFLVDETGERQRQLLWGDWLWLDPEKPDNDPDWRHVIWSPFVPEKTARWKIRREHTVDSRPLEVIFVDVGQGDGCVVISPERDHEERIIVIDAGKGPHMQEFLEGRFRGHKNEGFAFHAAIITHPDEDHYGGFTPIFAANAGKEEKQKFRFDFLYHSGLVERPVAGTFAKLGGLIIDPADSRSYCQALVETNKDLREAFDHPAGSFRYPTMIRHAIDHGGVTEFKMLSTMHGAFADKKTWMPGFAPGDRDYSIEILGPFVEISENGKLRLRKLGDYGQTKNGHSIILRLSYQNFRILLGGDLNTIAERFLLQKYGGCDDWPEDGFAKDVMMAKAGPRFRSEIMKVCHHGASDVTDEFIEAVNPSAFIISSGDQEGHVHPRPDLLGRLGKLGRGKAPVLLSTELQRSTRDREDASLIETIKKDIALQLQQVTPARQAKIEAALAVLAGTNVDVDGAIYVKTDGNRLICAFKKETGSSTDKWFYFEYLVVEQTLLLQPRKSKH